MNKLDKKYKIIARKILKNGKFKKTRNANTYTTFGNELRHNMVDGFPILTTKFISLKNVFTELKWFLLGRTDIRWLIENKCYIWNGDAHKGYLRKVGVENALNEEDFIKKIISDDDFNNLYGDLGVIYGAQWLNFNGNSEVKGFNQIEMILDLLKNDPDSRRIRVTAWNPSVLKEIVLPSCHTDFQFYTEELTPQEREYFNVDESVKRSLSLSFNCRSQDFFLGTPYNTSSYGLILSIIAKIFNYAPNVLIHLMGDTHIYEGHTKSVRKQLRNKGHELPKLVLKGIFDNVNDYWVDGEFKWIEFISQLDWKRDFELVDYKYDEKITAQLYT